MYSILIYFLIRLDSKAVQRLDGRILLRLQDLRKEVERNFYFNLIMTSILYLDLGRGLGWGGVEFKHHQLRNERAW